MLNPRVLLSLAFKKVLPDNSSKRAILFLLPSSGVELWMVTSGVELCGVTLNNNVYLQKVIF